MAAAINSSNPRVNAKQAVIIGVLGVVLVGVLVYGQPEAETVESPAAVAAETPVVRPVKTSPPKKKKWVKVALDKAVETNPFAELTIPKAPAAAEPEPVAREAAAEMEAIAEAAKAREAAMADLRTQKVSVILRHSGKATAMIGGRMVREGDLLNGFRVISILPTGVVFEAEEVPPEAKQ